MIVGGYTSRPYAVSGKVQIFDLSPQRELCPNLQNYPFGVESATGAIVSGVPVVCGGKKMYEPNLPQCYKYDNSTNSWTFLTNLTIGRVFSASVPLNDKLFVIGGQVTGYKFLSSTEYIPLDGGESQPGPELLLPRIKHCAVKLQTGKNDDKVQWIANFQ